MNSSHLGYPRIGENREWKKTLEAFWAGDIEESVFTEKMERIRLSNLQKQKERKIDLIPVNDFTYYDHILDTAVMFGVIPERYQFEEKGKVPLSVYFSMARGNLEAVASEMTKWFNTNYHYIVPELTDVQPRLTENKPLLAYREAKEKVGIKGKPVIVGLYTFLKLSKGYKEEQLPSLIEQLLPLYEQVLQELEQEGVEWVQIDEPILNVSLTKAEMATVASIYQQLSQVVPKLKIMLQTYFDSVEHYSEVINLPVAGIGLDFVHGLEENLANLQVHGFPQDKVLAVGIVDGKNIWRANLQRKDEIIQAIMRLVPEERLWIQPSCSLLHVPITVEGELHLPSEIKEALAFADEKLAEIHQLTAKYQSNDVDFSQSTAAVDRLNASACRNRSEIQRAVEEIHEEDFKRNVSYHERKKKQQKKWSLPVLPTTTIGSFPQSADVRKARANFNNGTWSKEQYESFINEQMKKWIDIQEEIGLDIFVHGEFERTDMVEYFGQRLSGFVFLKRGWVQSYGSRCVRPPVIYGDVEFLEPMTVKETIYAQSLTKKPVKGMLTGPVTILNWSFVRDDVPREKVCYQLALALRKEVEVLEAAGIEMIQVDEPALREGLPLKKRNWEEYLAWSVNSFLLTTSSVKDTTQIHTHMCYCDFNNFMEVISKLDADIISIETSRSHGELISSTGLHSYQNGIGLGVYDIHSKRVPEVAEIQGIIEKTLEFLDKEQIWINPDCGLKTRGEQETIQSLKNMVEATSLIRNQLAVKSR
ncbi:5-methyltetrahydropteroyltriglutamate--homocysteine S-methyltransferase [Bacillaceae bacterium SAS-127]|nr:5-methyltetrahydropteroyltriglutamate--homocysteine S-methyltransferase [Bacillaceae bacterium SAS-127]